MFQFWTKPACSSLFDTSCYPVNMQMCTNSTQTCKIQRTIEHTRCNLIAILHNLYPVCHLQDGERMFTHATTVWICMVISIRYMSWFTYLEENKQLSRYKAQEYMSAKYKVQYTEYKVQSKKYMSTNYMSTKFGFIIAHELECYIIHCQIICSSSSIHSQMKNSILVNFALSIQPLLAGMAQW